MQCTVRLPSGDEQVWEVGEQSLLGCILRYERGERTQWLFDDIMEVQ